MVKRVYGKANNFDVTFERQEDGKWRTAIPSNLDGEYYVELYAEDEAGNVGFLCKSLFIVFGHTLSIKILDNGYKGDLMDCTDSAEEHKKGYEAELTDTAYTAEVETCGYTAEYRKVGFTIERIVCCRNEY